MIRTIFFDMDGVMADFHKGFMAAAGFDSRDIQPNEDSGDIVDDWLSQNAVNEYFFAALPTMPNFDILYNLIHALALHGYEVRALTSCGTYDTLKIRNQKRKWLDTHDLRHMVLNYVEKSYQKAFFAAPNTLLIDDRTIATDGFARAGGQIILYKNASSTWGEIMNMGLLSE